MAWMRQEADLVTARMKWAQASCSTRRLGEALARTSSPCRFGVLWRGRRPQCEIEGVVDAVEPHKLQRLAGLLGDVLEALAVARRQRDAFDAGHMRGESCGKSSTTSPWIGTIYPVRRPAYETMIISVYGKSALFY